MSMYYDPTLLEVKLQAREEDGKPASKEVIEAMA